MMLPLSLPVIARIVHPDFPELVAGAAAASDLPARQQQIHHPAGFGQVPLQLRLSPWHLIMAVSIGAALPPVVLFFIGQRFLLSGIVVSDK